MAIKRFEEFAILGILIVGYTLSSQGNLVSECQSSCGTSPPSRPDIQCDRECKVQTCEAGCILWDNSTLQACNESCISEFSNESFKVQYCYAGCSYAEEEYAQAIIDSETPEAPVLAGIPTATSIALTWNAATSPEVSYVVQWSYTQLPDSSWTSFNAVPITATQLEVTGLIPYTFYSFRVVWVVIRPAYTTESPASDEVRTAAGGVPVDAPVITTLISPSPSTIQVAWEAVLFPAGDLQGYDLTLEGSKTSAWSVLPSVRTHVFTSLTASTSYNVSVAASNDEGQGPASRQGITTQSEVSDNSTIPYLVVGVDRYDFDTQLLPVSAVELLPLPVQEVLGEIVHETRPGDSNIIDVAVHYQKKVLFFIENGTSIQRKDISNLTTAVNESAEEILTATSLSKLDIDWLYDKIYFIENLNIMMSDLDGTNKMLAVGPLTETPQALKVDPFNGYLFWSESGGIYRLDIADIGIGAVNKRELIIPLMEGRTFTIDPMAYELFFDNSSDDSIGGAQLDGSEVIVARVGREQQQNMSSLVWYDSLFSWLRGSGENERLTAEEPDGKGAISLFDYASFGNTRGFGGLDVFHSSSQPIPTPVVAPLQLQALFNVNSTQLTWDPLKPLERKGNGAWQKWRYEVEVTEAGSQDSPILDAGEEVTSFTAIGLNAATEYTFRVRATSPAGNGPWSESFTGRTFSQTNPPAYILMANSGSIFKSSLDGSATETLYSLESAVIDLSWNQDNVFWIQMTDMSMYAARLDSGSVTLTALTGQESQSPRALAVDWLGEKIYWSDSDTSEIYRADLNLTTSELSSIDVIQQFAPARDIALDSVNGYIYWSEKLRLEGARLNGDDTVIMFQLNDFSDEEVAGITLDFESQKIFWFVLASSSGNSELRLYSASLLPTLTPSPTFVTVESNTMQATLHLFSQKLFWVNVNNQVTVSEEAGQRLAVLPFDEIEELTVVQSTTLQPYPDGFSEAPNVRPNDIDSDMIIVDSNGTWNNFSVTWPASVVDYGTVFYDVSIISVEISYTYSRIQEENFVTITEVDPFTKLTVLVVAFTYWSKTGVSTNVVVSPMSVPTVPQNPRLFVEEESDILTGTSTYNAVFRWEPVATPNGILNGYVVWWGTNMTSFQKVTLSNTSFEFSQELITSEEYFFKVAGCTVVGCGDATETLSGSSGAINPPPSFVTKDASGNFVILDDDSGEQIDGPSADVATYLSSDDLWYFIEANTLWKYKDGQKGGLEVGLTETPLQNSFTLDWVSRKLYWAVSFTIYLYDTTIDPEETDPVVLVSTDGEVEGLVVSPQQNLLVWSEKDVNTQVVSFKSLNLGGNSGQTKRKRAADDNDCFANTSIAGAFALDASNESNPLLYYTDEATNSIWVSDTNGCNGRMLFNGSTQTESALPATSMTVDLSKVYWINDSPGKRASVNKVTGSDFQITDSSESILISVGDELQPFPAPECLIPADPVMVPGLTMAYKDRLELQLTPVSTAPSCGSISLSTPSYTVCYGTVQQGNCSEQCDNYTTTTALSVTLDRLEPYTDYCVFVEASNMYTSSDGSSDLRPVTSEPMIYRTWVGVPSAPRNVTFEPLTSSEALIFWLEPAELNGPSSSLTYTVEIGNSEFLDILDTEYTAFNLEPATVYTVKVYVRHSNAREPDEEGESEEILGTTFEKPNPIEAKSKTYYSVTISWMAPDDDSIQFYRLEHRFLDSQITEEQEETEWTVGPEQTVESSMIYDQEIGTEAEPLRPYSKYQIRLQAQYVSGRWYRDEDIPQAETIEVTTDGDVPGTISPPQVDGDFVVWDEPEKRGPGDLVYTLQAKVTTNSDVNKRAFEDWTTVYEGTSRQWKLNLTENFMYVFRVSAANDIGTGSFSPESSPFMVEATPEDSNIGVIIGVVIAVVLFLIILLVILIYFGMRRKKEEKSHIGTVSYRTDTELATLRDYPTTMEGNQMYAHLTAGDGSKGQLPLFPRERLKLITFLGSGAFGEVFEGVALNILTDTSGKTKVAVKTLKKGATDEEKEDFLKEAMLMSNFHHANIMGLLGVCLDNDPQYIILELMEGGDLLSYLRGARATQETDAKLSEADLVDIVTDVARGCKYLEEMHFVHRDLAARNCLVSCKGYEDAKCRIVKIGDFGLARDIYKSDYYRKEGEGLLPVRWMAPEALIDGLFTNASDIWAFGVLVWEVFTYGQQPYPARTNIEVLKFVTEGGRLDRPENCPDDMYALMTKCWEKMVKARPSFLVILDRCEAFRRKSYGPGYDNEAFLEEKINYSLVNQNLETDDYLQPKDKQDIKPKPKPPNLVVEKDPNLKAPGPGEKKREGSFRRLLGGGSDSPKSPQPRLDAAANQQTWEQNKRAIDERYLAMPVGRSASSVQPSSKPDVPSASVVRGESVNIPAGASPRRLTSDSKKRRAPTVPAPVAENFGMPERPAPVPPSPSSQSSSRTSSQSSVSRPSGPPSGRPPSKKTRAPRAPPSQAANSQDPQTNGSTGGRTNHNPFRQFSEEGDDGKLQVEYYNV